MFARSIRDGVAEKIKAKQSTYPRFQPQLAIIQAGGRSDSVAYVRMKEKAAKEVGITFKHITFPAEVTVEEIVETVKKLNDDEQISGILVQLPLGEHVDADGERTVTEAVDPEKDVDGYAPCNLYKFLCSYLSVSTRTTSATSLRAQLNRSLPHALRPQ